MILAKLRDQYRRRSDDWPYLYHEPSAPYGTLLVEDSITVLDTDREYWMPRTGRSRDVFPAVLADCAKYYVGTTGSKDMNLEGKPRRQYMEQLNGLIEEEPHPALVAWRDALEERPDEITEAILEFVPKTRRHARKIVPIVDGTPLALPVGDDPTALHSRIASRALSLWKERKAEADGLTGQCMICREEGPIARVHPKVKFAGETVSLANCNEAAFESYGREQTTGTPMCPQCALEAHAGAALVRGSSVSKRQTQSFAQIEFIALSDGVGEDTLSLLSDHIDRPSALLDALRGALASVDRTVESEHLHLIALEGQHQRLRPLLNETTTVGACMDHIQSFCERSVEGVSLEGMVQAAHQVNEEDHLSIWSDEDSKPVHRNALLRLIEHLFLGRPLPPSLLTRWHTRRKARRTAPWRSEIALINLYIGDMDYEGTPAYHLGRVLFQADDVYRQSLSGSPDRYASNRYWRRLVDRPAESFGQLVQQLQSHLAKDDVYSRTFDDEAGALPDLPDQLSPKEHGIFALGYYRARREHFEGINGPSDDESEADEEAQAEPAPV
jgi:hypothetical protein